ncbi:MAG TPA: hypothetical protein VFT84_04160 [Gemmatimonadales bacterium]|nr:hypothetical protein [Gemmatimonadales bacterium]
MTAALRPTLVPLSNRVLPEHLLPLRPDGTIVACDFHVQNIHLLGEPIESGFRLGRLLNIDHHAPVPRMRRRISSAGLAIEHVRRHGPAGGDTLVVINHTDCDSVLSSAIVLGLLPPESGYAEAAIAADHTGEANPVADLLQALEHERDFTMSLRNLLLTGAGAPMEAAASALLGERLRRRERAAGLVAGGAFTRFGGVQMAVLGEETDGELFPGLLPDARLVMLAIPGAEAGTWKVKLRLGRAAPDGLTLPALGIEEFDPRYGGRWNAGSNRRGGGTTISPDRYAALVAERLERVLGARDGHP